MSEEEKEITIYITKWWQSEGIVIANAVHKPDDEYPKYSIKDVWGRWSPHFYYRDAFTSLELAEKDVERRRQKKVASMKKQIQKLAKGFKARVNDARGKSTLK